MGTNRPLRCSRPCAGVTFPNLFNVFIFPFQSLQPPHERAAAVAQNVSQTAVSFEDFNSGLVPTTFLSCGDRNQRARGIAAGSVRLTVAPRAEHQPPRGPFADSFPPRRRVTGPREVVQAHGQASVALHPSLTLIRSCEEAHLESDPFLNAVGAHFQVSLCVRCVAGESDSDVGSCRAGQPRRTG